MPLAPAPRRRPRVLPGFRLSLGFTLTYLGVLLFLPLGALVARGLRVEPTQILASLTGARALHALWLSIGCAVAAAAVNVVFGVITAWVLERYTFPGRRIVDGLIDLPFALPTSVAGITLAAMYGPNGILGKPLAALGIKAAYTPLGIILALTFVGLPFVVRVVQPVVHALDREVEEAAESLGATRGQVFRRVIFPELVPAALTGFALAFARGLGEYGSVIFIAGNMPNYSETVPLLIMIRLEQFDYDGATAIALAYLVIGFVLLGIIGMTQRRLALRGAR
ncbi:MAG: sulfate ABC transporter permease subunit CysT [Thermoanaerobaculia bacterium]